MKKTLLLSVVASTMIMAGGNIAPVEPVVETPVVVEKAPAWNFKGQAVAFTQTADSYGAGSLFSSDTTYAAVGVQLSAVNSNLIGGIGAGVEVSAIQSNDNPVIKGGGPAFYNFGGNAGNTSGGFTQAYLTYGLSKTSIKVGRQLLPKGLSPFAYSEGWQMFKNTMDAALVVNKSIPNTTLVYAYVDAANRSINGYADRGSFYDVGDRPAGSGPFVNNGGAVDGAHMIAAQNKSIAGLTLTGSYYYASNFVDAGDTSIIWGDAKYNAGLFNIAVQGGQISPDLLDSTSAVGVKLGAKFAGIFTAAVAYTSVGDGAVGMSNLATGIKSPLYTQMLLNNVGQFHAKPGSDFLKVSGTIKALGGKFILGYGDGSNSLAGNDTTYSEIDVMYKAKLSKNITGFAAYGYTDISSSADSSNFVRFWARYSF